MTDAEVRAAAEISALIARYARAADRGRAGDLACCFTPDGVLSIRGNTFDAGQYAGRAAITARIGESIRDLASGGAPLLRHHVSSIDVEVTGPGQARASAYFLAVTAAGPDHWGRYNDELACLGSAWLFRHRVVTHEGFRPGSWIEEALARLPASGPGNAPGSNAALAG